MEKTNGMAATRRELEPLLRPWVTALRQRSDATARSYETAIRQFLDVLGDRELDPTAVSDYLDSLEPLAPASKAAKVSAVRSFLKVAQDAGVVSRSPRDFLIRPSVAITSYGRYLDLDELRALLDAATELGPKNRAVVLALWTTGLRRSELAGARWRDLYRDPNGLTGLRVVGKGGKERVVRIHPELLEALAAIRIGAHPGSSELDAADPSPLIPSPRGGACYTDWGIWSLVRAAVKKTGLTKAASCHWLRHSYGTWVAHEGASPYAIRFAMGHSSIETSVRYVHAARGLLDAPAVPALD